MFAVVVAVLAATASGAADSKPTSATYVPRAQIEATLKRAPPDSVSDQQVRVVDVGKAQVALGAVYRSAKAKQNAVFHDQVSEMYYIIEGSGTLVTGGKLVDPKRRAADEPVVKDINGPSVGGTAIDGGESRRIAPGDVVIIPAGVPHWFSAIDGELRYIMFRVDPDKILPLK
jgi:mannose-6-phosphate isomerase-like protein (cupin superfamily)